LEKKIISFLQTDFQLPFGDDGQTVREERDGGREEREKGVGWGWEDRERENERKTRGAGEEERERQTVREAWERNLLFLPLPPSPPSLPGPRPQPDSAQAITLVCRPHTLAHTGGRYS